MQISDEIRPFFWDVNIDTLDKEKHKQYIISRMFNFGDDIAINWVRNEYSDNEIEEVARNSRNFTKKSAEFLRNIYNLEEDEMKYYVNAKEMGDYYFM